MENIEHTGDSMNNATYEAFMRFKRNKNESERRKALNKLKLWGRKKKNVK